MIFVYLIRIFRAAVQNFWRNIWLSIATTLIMTLTLLTVSFLYLTNILGAEILRTIEQKVDLSVTFKEDIKDDQITIIAGEIGAREDVEDVRVVTSEDALALFRERRKDDPFIEESLRELDGNPLPSSMFIVATDARFYQSIANNLSSEKYSAFIEKVNFEDSRVVIEKLISLISRVKNVGFIATTVFAVLVILIMFNTIRLAIYSFREEIDIMRLVGASNWFIKGPFVFEAMMVAIVAIVISNIILFPTLQAAAPHLQEFFFAQPDVTFNIYNYTLDNWIKLIGLQALLSIGLAMLSSTIAVSRYLKR